MPWWTMDLFERELVGLELDMFKSKKFKTKLMANGEDLLPAGEGGGPTSVKVLHVEDRALKSCADNAVGVLYLMLSEYNNKRICETILGDGSHVKDWRSKMARDTRSAEDTRTFLREQCRGGFWEHLEDGIRRMFSAAHLESLRFAVPGPLDKPSVIDDETLNIDEEFADMTWNIKFGFYCYRGYRGLYLVSWPVAMTQVLEGAVIASSCLSEFKDDVDIFSELDDMADKPKMVASMYKRHLFQTVANKQYIAACRDVGFGPLVHPDFRMLVWNRSGGVITTNVNEELVGTTKNSKEVKSVCRFRRPETSFARILSSDMLSKRFKWDQVVANDAVEGRGVRVDNDAFEQKRTNRSMPLLRCRAPRRVHRGTAHRPQTRQYRVQISIAFETRSDLVI